MAEGKKLHGSDSAWDVAANAIEHASDINAAVLLRHLPAPVAIGDMAIVNAASSWALLTDVAAGRPLLSGGVATVPAYAGWALAGTAGQTYTFPAAGGIVALLNAANSFTLINPITTIAESWIGPSATTGIYFKDGKVGLGTIPPAPLYLFHVRAADGISDNSYVAYIGNEEATANRNNGLWINAGSSASDYNIRCASVAGAALWSVTGAGLLTAINLNLSATANQIVLQSAGVTGTLTWTPAASNKVITLPNLTGTVPLGTGTAGQIAEWVTDTHTLQAAKLIGPAANILTITNAAASTLALAITAGKTLTLTAADDFNLTIPDTGRAVLWLGAAATGAVVADPTYGNARGTYAVDLQTAHNAITQVAGDYAAILGGAFNTASGNASVVLGGDSNVASGVGSTVLGGTSNIASGAFSIVMGGDLCVAAGDLSVAWGLQAKIAAAHDGTFLFSDFRAEDFNSIAANEAAFRVAGGFRVAFDDFAYFAVTVADTTGVTTFATLPVGAGFVIAAPVTFSAAITATAVVNPLTTAAESWIGPSSTAGIYFKGSNVGVGTNVPGAPLEVKTDSSGRAIRATNSNNYGLWINPWGGGTNDVNVDPTANGANIHFGRDYTVSNWAFESGSVKIASLAGVGSRAVVAAADGTLSAP